MNLETTIAIRAYGTVEGVQKAWDTRGRGMHPQAAQMRTSLQQSGGKMMSHDNAGTFHFNHPNVGRVAVNTSSGGWKSAYHSGVGAVSLNNHISSFANRMAARAGCRGANCGRKGKKAGAVPLRTYTTKQETNTLKSKAMKHRRRKSY